MVEGFNCGLVGVKDQKKLIGLFNLFLFFLMFTNGSGIISVYGEFYHTLQTGTRLYLNIWFILILLLFDSWFFDSSRYLEVSFFNEDWRKENSEILSASFNPGRVSAFSMSFNITVLYTELMQVVFVIFLLMYSKYSYTFWFLIAFDWFCLTFHMY